MKITKYAVDRPVTTSMLFLALVFFGILSYNKLAVNLLPDLKLPVIVVNTINYGATPEEIESEITDKIEKEVIGLNNIKLLQSYSMDNSSMIIIQFDMKKDPDKALSEVKEKLDLVIPELPKEAERPYVLSYNPNDAAILNIVVGGDQPANEIYEYANRILKEKLLKIEGVSKAELTGGEIREIKILADKRRMYEVEMNLTDVSAIVNAINIKLSGGDFSNEHRQFAIETGNKFNDIKEIENTYIPHKSGPLRIGDFADVIDTVKNIKSKSSFFDVAHDERYGSIVNIGVLKKSSANAVEVADAVKETIAEMQDQLPDGISLSIPYDSSKYVKSSVDDALTNVVLGIILTGFILLFFLGDIRTTLIVSISIPVSLIATFTVMRSINASLNMMTLMSFSVAIGALISNSIVVIENILRLKKAGMPIKEAAVKGTQEVMMAVIASTGTNLVVFLPIATMTSITGAFFREYALTISAATIFSLVVSFLLTPMLTSVIFRKERKPGKFSLIMERFFTWLEIKYEKSLASLISKKWKPLALFGIMFAVFLLSTGLLTKIGFEFEPKEDSGNIFVELELTPGTSIDESARIVGLVEKKVSDHKEVKGILNNIGEKNFFTTGTNLANMIITLVPKEERAISNAKLAETIYKELDEIPEVIPFISTSSSVEGTPLAFTLQSMNTNELEHANTIVNNMLKNVEGILNYESTFRKGNQVIHVQPKQRFLAELGLSPIDLAMSIRSNINGIKASVFKEKGKEYDITVSYPQNQINSIEKIRQIPFFTNSGVFTIEQLAEIDFKNSQAQIVHKDKLKTVEFSIIPQDDVATNEAQKNIEKAMADIDLPTSVEMNWSGNIKELDDTVSDMIVTFVIALLLMYMLLASLLENFWHPVIIFTTVPMAMIGVFVFMYVGGTTMNIMSLMAIITLLGLVVNDDILIHDYTEQLREKGMKLRKATLLAGKTKMKTVIMTTIAIIAGMLPNAMGIGDAGSEFRTPMAVVTIGGILTSTVLTLYLIPSLFYVIRNKKTLKN
ncbi:MAG: efflux RND transporter permease subunit [Cytophagales bacterium]|nr:efflux RND transporter permease subunit [Cytophagales bacterium]